MSQDLKMERGQDDLVLLLQKTEDGEISALESYANLKEFEKLIKDAIGQIAPLAQNEADGYSEKSFSFKGFLFEKRNGSTRYSFKGIPSVEEIEKQLKDEKDRIKSAYLAKQKNILVATEDGEDIPNPIVTYTSDVLISKKIIER